MYCVVVHFPYQDSVYYPMFETKDDAHEFRAALNRCLPRVMRKEPQFWCENDVKEVENEDCC